MSSNILRKFNEEITNLIGSFVSVVTSNGNKYKGKLIGITENLNLVIDNIESKEEKSRLNKVLKSIRPKGFGIIIRTVATNKKVADLDSDLQRLAGINKKIQDLMYHELQEIKLEQAQTIPLLNDFVPHLDKNE